jgi:hypothetical protein
LPVLQLSTYEINFLFASLGQMTIYSEGRHSSDALRAVVESRVGTLQGPSACSSSLSASIIRIAFHYLSHKIVALRVITIWFDNYTPTTVMAFYTEQQEDRSSQQFLLA